MTARPTTGQIALRLAIGWTLALVTALAVMHHQREVGIARDEVIYIHSGERYASWWLGLVTGEHGPGESSVTRTFGGPGSTDNNREHPPLMKTLFGLSDRVFHKGLGVLDEVSAARLPSALLAGVAVAVTYFFALAIWGLAEAIFAGLLVMWLPRAMFHAGLACFDAPTMTLWLVTVYAYWRCLDGRRWPWQVGVAWGLALATKHTALLLPFALGAHYVIVGWRARPRPGAGGLATARAVLGHRWRVIVSLAVLGPATLYVLWPWLWFDPVHHVRDWLAFHTGHVHYNYEYLGTNWNAPRFPWHTALVTTLFTVPVATLAAAFAGTAAWLVARPARPGAPGLLLALSAAASIGPFLVGTTPIFGAEKHWMPVLPSICIAAGAGVAWVARRAVRRGAEVAPARPARLAIALVGGPVVLAAIVETRAAAPYALTWYNALAGGTPGGADLGMNRQFWGVAARGALPVLSAEAAKPTAAEPTWVYTHDASPAWSLYQRLGLIPPGLPDAGGEQAGIARSQLAIVIHERHFNRHDYLIWSSYGTIAPIHVLRAHGVPIVSVYRRPRDD